MRRAFAQLRQAYQNIKMAFKYPGTRIDDCVETLHGVQVHDRFRWLEVGYIPLVFLTVLGSRCCRG